MLHRLFLSHMPLRLAVYLWIALAVAVCVKSAKVGGQHSVYPVFAGATRHWWADWSLYAEYWPTEHIDGYRYSPAFAVLFTPFAALPGYVGEMIWNTASLALLFFALLSFVRHVLPGEWTPWREGVFLLLTLFGSAVGAWSSQSNALILALILFGLAAIARQRWWAAAFFLATPVFLKIWPIVIVLLLWMIWPRRLTVRLAAVAAVLLLLPFLTRPPSVVAWQYAEWYRCLTGPLQGRWYGYRDAWTIFEQLCPALHCPASQPANYRGYLPHSYHAYKALQLAGLAAMFGWCWLRRKRLLACGRHGYACMAMPNIGKTPENMPNRETDADRQFLTGVFSIWAAWQLFLGPGTEQLTYGLIAPAAAWAVLASFQEKSARWLTVAAWVLLTFCPSGDVEKAVLQYFPQGRILAPLGTLLFIVWLLWHEWQIPALTGRTKPAAE